MAWRSDTVWELRPDGASTNGIGFSAALGGQDFSQQTAAAISVADGVTNGSTTVTSATAGFTAVHVGNGLNIVGDGLYQITVINSATSVTVDRVTANGGAGRSMKVGGAGTIQNATGGFDPIVLAVLAAGHKQWVRDSNAAGVVTTYNLTPGGQPGLTVSGTATNPITTEGYHTVRGDGGRPVIQFTGWALLMSGSFNIFRNATVQFGTAAGTVSTLHLTGGQCHLENLVIDPGGTNGPALLQDGGGANNNVVRRVFTKANTAAGGGTSSFDLFGTGCLYEYCDVTASGGQNGVSLNSVAQFWGCIFRDNAGSGVRQNGQVGSQFKGCIFWNNGIDGLRLTNAGQGVMDIVCENCIFGMNAGYDLNYTPSDISANTGALEWAKNQLRCNFFFTTGTGRYHFLPAGADDTALTANPFVSSGGGNFTLNQTAGGGAVVSSSLCAVPFADGLNTANVLAGFYGTITAGSGTTAATLINLWRELTNERSLVAVPDATVAIYIDWGLQALNRASRYHYTTDTTTLTLVANQQEYAAPSDMLDIRWIRYGFKELQKGDIERWRGDDLAWSQETPGEPREWAQYGLQIVLRPAPSAEAVTANPTCTMRYVSNPPGLLTAGPEQLSSSAWRLAVVYGAYLWSAVYPDTVLSQQRMAALKQEFTEGAQLFASEMASRAIGR